jgi:hypothetical protein
MGVGITAYSKLALTEEHERDDRCYDEPLQAFTLEGFSASLRGLEDGRCYERTADTDDTEIMYVPYSSYNRWREQLSVAALGVAPQGVWKDPDAYRDCPFFELINFADNEGTIGPEAAADLLADFGDHPELADTVPHWQDWIDGLRLAADGGLVDFH